MASDFVFAVKNGEGYYMGDRFFQRTWTPYKPHAMTWEHHEDALVVAESVDAEVTAFVITELTPDGEFLE